MSITRILRTPIQHRVVRNGNTIYIGGAIARRYDKVDGRADAQYSSEV